MQHIKIDHIRIGWIEASAFQKEVLGRNQFAAKTLNSGHGPVRVRQESGPIGSLAAPRLPLWAMPPDRGFRIEWVYESP
jgi:hypothetical protein